MKSGIQNPAGLDIIEGGRAFHGADQDWFSSAWRRQAGCGPTTAANMLRYMKERAALRLPCRTKQEMQALMDWVWGYVTPGLMGLNTPQAFREGMDRLLSELGSPLRCRVLEVAAEREGRPSGEETAAFLSEAFRADSPVAFLNLDRGALGNLESWHWVSLIGLEREGEGLMAEAADNGRLLRLDLGLWLETTKRRGGFVYLAE